MIFILKNKAFGLIEVLIATVILAIGLLGIATLQQKAMWLSRDAENGAVASMLATEMVNRIKSNKVEAIKGSSSGYVASFTPTYTPPGNISTLVGYCYSATGCTSQYLAYVDIYEWMQQVALLPSGNAIICYGAASGSTTSVLDCSDVSPAITVNPPPSYVNSDPYSFVYTIKISWKNSNNVAQTNYLMTKSVHSVQPFYLTPGMWQTPANAGVIPFHAHGKQYVISSRTGNTSSVSGYASTPTTFTYNDVNRTITNSKDAYVGTVGLGASSITWWNGGTVVRTDTFISSALNILYENNCMHGMCLVSPSGLYETCQQQIDGHLVTYRINGGTIGIPNGIAIWGSTAWGPFDANGYLCMQTDGNLVTYTTGGIAYWASGTGPPTGWASPWYAIIKDDDNFVLYDANSVQRWASGVH